MRGMVGPFVALLRSGASHQAIAKFMAGYYFLSIRPDKVGAEYEQDTCQAAWLAEVKRRRLQGAPIWLEPPYQVDMTMVMQRPKRLGVGIRQHTDKAVRPDINNVYSALLDGLQLDHAGGKDGRGIIVDDAYVVLGTMSKVYASSEDTEAPYMDVTVRSLTAHVEE